NIWTTIIVTDVNLTNNFPFKAASLHSKRMVGGTLAPHVPWQAMIYLSDSVNLFIRKSRQDIQGKDPVIPKVYLGITRKEEVFLHPGFQNQTDWDNDLALIKLKESVTMSAKVTPIPLPERGQDLDTIAGGSGVFAGWGWGILLTPATSLKYLVLPLANHSDCKAEYERTEHTPRVDGNMFCTRPTAFEENVCFGDAGGALAVRDARTGDVYAAGILSYDKSCNRYNYGVYVKISSYSHIAAENMEDADVK
uniref:Peptidase S1 domain-containing protein n=1 Tax=Fundulus heteroclitus TaxID=8078 RepID=A0A3Q2QYJ0_FUNHE